MNIREWFPKTNSSVTYTTTSNPYQTMAVLFLDKLPFNPLSLIPLFLLLNFLHKWLSISHPTNKNRPPSPPKLPIIGNLHQIMGRFPHRSLLLLSEQYGKLMLLHFGSKPTLIVSSLEGAREIMMTQELSFINRPNLRFINRICYDCKDIAFGRYGKNWRYLRSIAVTEVLSNKKVQSFQRVREEEVALMVDEIKGSDSPVNLSAMILRLSNDIVSRTAFGRKYNGDDGGIDFEGLFRKFVEVMGAISVGDFVPWLGRIDRVTGLEGKAEKVRKDFDEFFGKVIQEHVDRSVDDEVDGEEEEKVKDFVDILLQIQRENPTSLSMGSIHGVLLDIFTGATETTYTVLEWAMTEVLRHPRVMKKLQEEVRGVVKSNKRLTEDDLKNMKYLNAVIKETFRFHPPGPLLVFRESSKDVKINGYDIVAGTQVITNAWAIQHDKTCWEKPEEFYPERFINSLVDFRGQHFQLIPFGGGRRGCPGISYSLATIELVLASLVYEFDWKLPGGVACETLDAVESEGIIVHRRHPLTLIATPYSCK